MQLRSIVNSTGRREVLSNQDQVAALLGQVGNRNLHERQDEEDEGKDRVKVAARAETKSLAGGKLHEHGEP